MTIPPVRPPAVSFVYLFLLHCLSPSDHVVIVVMDGTEHSETMGDKSNVPTLQHWPDRNDSDKFPYLLPCSAHTLISETIPGHSGITIGTHQDLSMTGRCCLAIHFQYYRKEKEQIPHLVLCFVLKKLDISPIHQIHSGR